MSDYLLDTISNSFFFTTSSFTMP